MEEFLDVLYQVRELFQPVWSREGKIGEEGDGIGGTDAVVSRDEANVVPVVFHGGADVKSLYPMVVEGGALHGRFVHNDLASCRGEGIPVVVKGTVDKGIC